MNFARSVGLGAHRDKSINGAILIMSCLAPFFLDALEELAVVGRYCVMGLAAISITHSLVLVKLLVLVRR